MRCPICGADSDNPKARCCMDKKTTPLHRLLERIEARVNQVGTDEFSQLEILRLVQALKTAIEQRDLYIDLIGKYEDETTAGFIERRNAELAAILSGEYT